MKNTPTDRFNAYICTIDPEVPLSEELKEKLQAATATFCKSNSLNFSLQFTKDVDTFTLRQPKMTSAPTDKELQQFLNMLEAILAVEQAAISPPAILMHPGIAPQQHHSHFASAAA